MHTGRYYIKTFLANWFQIEKEELTPYLTILEHEAAVEHLFRVACGLDSMILGETQILGQVRSSYLLAQKKTQLARYLNSYLSKRLRLRNALIPKQKLAQTRFLSAMQQWNWRKRFSAIYQRNTYWCSGQGKWGNWRSKTFTEAA